MHKYRVVFTKNDVVQTDVVEVDNYYEILEIYNKPDTKILSAEEIQDWSGIFYNEH